MLLAGAGMTLHHRHDGRNEPRAVVSSSRADPRCPSLQPLRLWDARIAARRAAPAKGASYLTFLFDEQRLWSSAKGGAS